MWRFCLLFTLLLITCFCFGEEEPDWRWFTNMQASDRCKLQSSVIDSSGNMYVAGTFNNNMYSDVDTLTGVSYTDDPFIAKVDDVGNCLWLKRLPQVNHQFSTSNTYKLVLDSDQNIIGVNSFVLETTRPTFDIGLFKVSSDGDSLWMKKISGDVPSVSHLAFYNDKIYIFANAFSPISYNNQTLPGSNFYSELMIVTDTNGNYLRSDEFTGGYIIGSSGIFNGSITFFGRFNYDFSVGNVSVTNCPYNQKYTIEYNETTGWHNIQLLNFEGNSNCIIKDMIIRGSDKVISGTFRDSIVFNTDTLFAENQYQWESILIPENFVAVLDSTGTWTYACKVGSDHGNTIEEMKMNEDGAIYFTGCFWDSSATSATSVISISQLSETSSLTCGSYITRLNPDNTWDWMKILDMSSDPNMEFQLNSYNEIIIACSFTGDAQFDNHVENGGHSIVIGKLSNQIVKVDPNVNKYESLKLANYPNPFNPETTIEFSLNKKCNVELTIYNMKGQKVRTLVSGTEEEGLNKVIWKGDDSTGHKVGSGVYFYKLDIDCRTEAVKKCVMLK